MRGISGISTVLYYALLKERSRVLNCPELLLFGFTSLPSVIGLKSLRHFPDQSDSKLQSNP